MLWSGDAFIALDENFNRFLDNNGYFYSFYSRIYAVISVDFTDYYKLIFAHVPTESCTF